MSDDRFRDVADRIGRDPEETRLIREGLKAAREGRDADLFRVADRLTRERSKIKAAFGGMFVGAVWGFFAWFVIGLSTCMYRTPEPKMPPQYVLTGYSQEGFAVWVLAAILGAVMAVRRVR